MYIHRQVLLWLLRTEISVWLLELPYKYKILGWLQTRVFDCLLLRNIVFELNWKLIVLF